MARVLTCSAQKDIIWGAVGFLVLIALLLVFDLGEVYVEKLLAALTGLLAISAWFSWRRWREYQRELHRRLQSEARLQISEDRLRDMLEASSDRFWETDEQYRIVWRTAPIGQTSLLDPEVIGKQRWEIIGADPCRDESWAAHLADLEARKPFRHFRFAKLKDGQTVYRSLSGKPVFDDEGRFKGYRGTTTDITHEIEAETKAAEAQMQFLSAIETIAEGYALWDRDDRLITCNDKFARSGKDRGVAVQPGMTFETFIRGIAYSGSPVDAVGREEAWIKEHLDHHQTANGPVQVAHDDRWLEAIDHRLPNGSTLTINRDITAQKELEQKLQQAQKLKAVGQLTGGIAHDFNNLLQVILGNIELIVEQAPAGSKIATQARIVQSASERGADLIRRLMAFSRQQTLQPHVFDVNEMVTEMGEIVRRVLGEDIVVRTHLAGHLPPVYVDHGQTEAAFLNIAVNSRDAMREGGTLFIETEDMVLEQGDISDGLELAPGRYVKLMITDTGSGMTSDVLARAFEPFFTTKEVGKGTGLGLSMIYGFVKQSGGDVKIYSEPGIGTAIKLYLPTARKPKKPETPDCEKRPVARGSETVLLVEDEQAVRNYAVQQLENLGYHVIAAPDGITALETAKDLDGCVDLLFTDIVMPGGMNGHQLAQRVAALYPNLKVLYTSGYNQNVVVHAGQLQPDVVLLEKPYHKSELARKLRQVLDA